MALPFLLLYTCPRAALPLCALCDVYMFLLLLSPARSHVVSCPAVCLFLARPIFTPGGDIRRAYSEAAGQE